jgi:hypothetical protein
MRVVLVVVVGVLLGSTTSCTGRDADASQGATLRVHIGLFGGPATLDGKMALRNSPAPNENVTAVNEVDQESTGLTDADGVATMNLAPGRYSVFSTYCGGSTSIALVANKTSRVRIDCPIP